MLFVKMRFRVECMRMLCRVHETAVRFWVECIRMLSEEEGRVHETAVRDDSSYRVYGVKPGFEGG